MMNAIAATSAVARRATKLEARPCVSELMADRRRGGGGRPTTGRLALAVGD
jgi:hypothetical protein